MKKQILFIVSLLTLLSGIGQSLHASDVQASNKFCSIKSWGNQVTPNGELTNINAIAAGYSHSFVLKADGSIFAWGYNEYSQATAPEGNDFVAIAAGEEHSLAIRRVSSGPVELLFDLIDHIDLQLPKGNTNGLLAKLDNTLKLLENETVNSDIAAINLLKAFINAVDIQSGKKIFKPEAEALIAVAQQIIDLLNDPVITPLFCR